MRWTRAATLPWILALGACSFVSDLDPLRGSDGGQESGTDAGVDVVIPQKGFTLAVEPAYVISDPGEIHSITVTLTRAAGFTDPVNVALNGPPIAAGISGQSALVFSDATTSAPITFKVDGAPTQNTPLDVKVTGQSGIYTKDAFFKLHIGTLLASSTSTPKYVTVTVPSYASSIDVKLWGGGGAGGGWDGSCNPSVGGAGGGGGFISARVPVPPSASLELVVGAGATPNTGTGGGGGGYSAVRLNGVPLVVAGGGGGAARNNCSAVSGTTAGEAGHSTFNAKGCTGKNGSSGGAGSGNGGAGSALTGGAAFNGFTKGGLPGGGAGGTAGGGGAGAIGGGAGGSDCAASVQPGGGGGGSGSAVTGSTAVNIVAGSGTTAGGANDPEYGGVAVGGAAGQYPNTNPGAGGSGKVIVRLTKTP